MKIVLPADGRAMMIVRSPFLIASKHGADSFTIKGDSFQMTDISAEKILLLPDEVDLSEGETIMPEIAAQALPIEAFLAATAEEMLADVLGLVLRAAVADGKITDEELLRVAPALESRAWRTELDVSLGDVYSHGGFLWRCIQAHTTQTGWEPDKTPALWRKVEIIHEDTKRIWQSAWTMPWTTAFSILMKTVRSTPALRRTLLRPVGNRPIRLRSGKRKLQLKRRRMR